MWLWACACCLVSFGARYMARVWKVLGWQVEWIGAPCSVPWVAGGVDGAVWTPPLGRVMCNVAMPAMCQRGCVFLGTSSRRPPTNECYY